MPKKLLLVDAPNHAFRAYHAIQSDMRAPDGFPTRCLYGFSRMLLALVREHQPDYVAFVFDVGKSFRNALYPAYKGQRPDMPDDLRQQWGELRPLIEAFGFHVIAEPNTEADDVIGTLACRLASDDVHVGIVSSDKDFGQLVDHRIHLLDLMKGVDYGPDQIREKWGVGPDRIIDLLSLMGDTSDNVPGVPGVGEKKAAQFIQKFGDLEGVLANTAAIGGKTGQCVADNAEAVRLARRLVTIDTAVPLDVGLDTLVPRPRDENALREKLARWNFKTLLTDLGLGAPPPMRTANAEGWHTIECTAVWGPGPLAELDRRLRAAGRVALAVETSGPDFLVDVPTRITFGWTEAGHPHLARVPVDDASLAALRALLADPDVEKTGFDLKQTTKFLASAGAPLAGVAGDVMVADYLLVPEQKHTLDDLGKRYVDHPLTGALGEEAQLGWMLDALLTEKLEENGVSGVYRDIELPLVPVLADMERAGIGVDVGALAALSAELGTRLVEEERNCHTLAGCEFNVASTQQLAEVLFDKLGLKGGKRTKTGWSTDADTLDKLREEHPLPGAILAWRELSKLKGTYVDALPPAVHPRTARIHTNFRQTVAATGRLSSIDPNLQNIPVRSDEGRRIRRCFVAAPGHVFLSADYSQIELRILAHYCQEGPLVESFRNDEDIHRRTASEIFGVMPGLVSPEMRRAAKAINFGIVYGMGAFRLANDLRISRTEAQSYIDGYFARYPQVRAYMDGAIARAREKGYAETLYGRRRPNQGLDAKNPMDRSGAERIAINTPIQGTAADLIKLAMVRVHADLAGTPARLLLQVHDELVIEVPEGDVAAVAARVKATMEGAASLCVPLKVDTGWARTWDAAH
ncbi:MAG: DNA polymerase I [Pseudomonadota bacterium]|nr:DNA polymerase I [Pseudomonadota bacterium]